MLTLYWPGKPQSCYPVYPANKFPHLGLPELMFPETILATLNRKPLNWELLKGKKNPWSVPKAHLEVFRAELVAVHVDGGQEDGLYLVVP